MRYAGILVLGALVALTGCAAAAPSEEDYLTAVRDLDTFSHMDDDALVAYGESYCAFLAEFGGSSDEERRAAAETFLRADVDAGGDIAETAIAAGTAVQVFCPELSTD